MRQAASARRRLDQGLAPRSKTARPASSETCTYLRHVEGARMAFPGVSTSPLFRHTTFSE